MTVVVDLAPLILGFFFLRFFLQIGALILLFGVAFMILIHNSLLKSIFDKLEAKKEKDEAAKLAAAEETEAVSDEE